MKVYEIGTGYTSIPAKMGAATEIVVEELTRAMMRIGIDVTILDIKDKNRPETHLPIEEVYMPQLFSTGAVVKLGVIHKIKRVLYSISLAIKLRGIIKNSEEKLVLHFHNQYNLFFFLKLISKRLRKKVVIGYTVHSYIWYGEWEKIKMIISKRYFQEVYSCQCADKVFVLNDIARKMLVDHYNVDSARICTVINGVNIDVYNEKNVSDDDLTALRDRYGLKGKKIIFQVGSVCDRKNQLGTLELMLPLLKRDSSLVFSYAGGIIDQEYADKISEKAKEEGVADQVIYFGEVSPGRQLNLLYTLSDVCIMNSKSESFALVIAEALSIPRPIFINKSILESLTYWGENIGKGILVIDEDFEKNIQMAFDDKNFLYEMKKKGRHFVESEYSWDKVAKKYIQYLA